jgi:ABC-type Fe3+ transport system substrate-binding protein
VYTARHYGQEPALEAFTKKTGIQVKLLAGSTGELFERLKAEGERTPADVLLTVDAGNLWNAARAGLLSKIDSPELLSNVPASLRDPESRWFGLTVRARTIMYNTGKVKPAELSTYLLEFLSTAEAQQMFADVAFEYPANPQAAVSPLVAKWGKFKQDDINIASAGEFQAAATRLADRAGYK